jgi:hypothetical protein
MRRGLEPLGAALPDRKRAAELRAERRIRIAWPLLVGSPLQRLTRPLMLRSGCLVVGCWEPSLVPSLRLAAADVWPEVRARLERMLRLKVQRLDVVACDPPETAAPEAAAPGGDALKELLARAAAQRKTRLDRA